MKKFDDDYARRVREGCFKAILDASVKDGMIRLNEHEIYDGVVCAIAMIHSAQDHTPSEEQTAMLSEAIARHFRERVAEMLRAKELDQPSLRRAGGTKKIN
ncbi:hypothetical protein [Microvirga terricola]|uniref:Uncharacterized protein n=1 Tax=Microvirga terricola TaxID=2719797 RepID=A0ABX0VFX8_9HYPH|nr:hypothetical protein [Microvirga terricola]NIX78109.1 hypothetical protein [Microvirga terricola]